MTIDFVCKTYQNDAPWLQYCLASLRKFCTGFRQVVVLVPTRDHELFKLMNLTAETTIPVSDHYPDSYLGQQFYKLMADVYTDADLIYYFDSDIFWTRPFKPQDIMRNGRPIILYTPYEHLNNADGTPATPWQKITEKALGHPVSHEFMRQNRLMTPRALLPEFREYMRRTHGMSLEQYIFSQPSRAFSEFNALMAYAFYHHPDLFHWHNTITDGVPEPYIIQAWSYGGLTDETRARYDAILAS